MLANTNQNSNSTVWQNQPTTADLIVETSKVTVQVSGLPQGVHPYEVGQRLIALRLPLAPLAAGQCLTRGEEVKEVKLADGRLLCTTQSDSFGRTTVKFTEVLSDLLGTNTST